MPSRPDYEFFDISPRVVPADATTPIEIRPLQPQCRCDSYEIAYWPMDGYGGSSTWQPPTFRPVTPTDGVISFDQLFEAEQEHVVVLRWKAPGGAEREAEFHVYSLADDLFARRPYKGDVHLHSCHSDGVNHPTFMPALCRRIGLDFMALTDHGMYGPSLQAIAAYDGVDVDIRMVPGEEVHLPGASTHILNIGGSRSVNLTGQGDHEPFMEMIEARADALGPLPDGVDPIHYAVCLWAFDEIREVGGLGVFCHPYWVTAGRYHPGMPLTDHLFDTQPFDAYEVIGGYGAQHDSNTLQTAHYHHMAAQGRKIPIIGVTDAHRTAPGSLFGRTYTIVFAPTDEPADLIAAIKDLYSVAMESMPDDRPRPVGPLRLVKVALFLEREIFPFHDELCAEEGRVMLAHAAGDPAAAEDLTRMSGRVKALYDRYWAKP